jgi:ABC-type sugar transport system permease subunit
VPQIVEVVLNVAVAVAVVVGIFVGLNALVDLAPRRFTVFATIIGALGGAVVGALANSGGWFLGGPLWPLGGAALGALLGGFVWARRPPSIEKRRRIPSRWRPAIFLAPALLFLGVTLVVPTIRTIYLSFRSRRSDEFVGLRNFTSVFTDESIFSLKGLGNLVTSRLFVIGVVIALFALAWTIGRGLATRRGVDMSAPAPVLSLTLATTLLLLAGVGTLSGVVIWNNVFWVVFVTGVSTVAGLSIAWLADRARGESIAKSLIFMPMAISFVGASVIWRFVYAFTPAGHDQIGLLNAVWVGFGGDPQAWIQQRPWNTLFLIAIMIWIQTGFAMVVLSAAIKAVPHELTEAALVDGASEGQIFWRVTIPQILPTIAVVVTTLIVVVLKIYDIVKVMTNGEFGTNVVANQMFQEAFINRDFGRGSALAVLLFIAVVPLMVVNIRRLRKAAEA